MHDFDLVRAELAGDTLEEDTFLDQRPYADLEYEDSLEDERDEMDDEIEDEQGDGYDGEVIGVASPYDRESPLDEDEEIDLASGLLAATNEEDLERAVRNIVRPRRRRARRLRQARQHQEPQEPQAADLDEERSPDRQRRRQRRRSFLGKALKGIAKKALPVLGGAVGSLVAPGVGTAAGAALAGSVGKAFGLELEGLSPEDQLFEVARRIVRLGAEAADETDSIDPSVDDATAAKVGVIRAAGKHAPGVMPRPDGSEKTSAGPSPRSAPSPGTRRPTRGPMPAQSGRWQRRGNHIVLLGL
jgi:hypothetical protein